MNLTKEKMAGVIAVTVLFTAVMTAAIIKGIEAYDNYRDCWRVTYLDSDILDKAPAQVRILPSKFPPSQENGWTTSDNGRKWAGIGVDASWIAGMAYACPPSRVFFPGSAPEQKYDAIATLAEGSKEALQRELKNKLRFVGTRETKGVDVLVLKVRNPNAAGLTSTTTGDPDGSWESGHYHCVNKPFATVAWPDNVGFIYYLEDYFDMPVIDETGLTDNFTIDIKWDERDDKDPKHDEFKKALLDQLGLELVPDHRPVEMLVVRKVR
jgi:uncharacterized protein (TIGR03435 family)